MAARHAAGAEHPHHGRIRARHDFDADGAVAANAQVLNLTPSLMKANGSPLLTRNKKIRPA